MPTKSPKARSNRQRGVALIAVCAALALAAAVSAEFSYGTTVDYASAANARDEMRAYFLARSGMNLSLLVIKTQKEILDRYRRYIGDVQLADYLPLMMGAFGGSKEEIEDLTAALGIGGLEQAKGLGLPEGQFDVQVSTEDGKINVNCANGSPQTQQRLAEMLAAMVISPSYDRLFEDRDGDGQVTDRLTFVRAMVDYADRDQAAFGQGGQPEDYGYESRDDSYKAKDNYVDTIDELQLVRGMDDRKWAVFGPSLTVYGGCKINLGAANDLPVLMSLIAQAAKNPEDPVLRDPVRLLTLAVRVAQARSFGIMFDDPSSFVEFVKSPDALLSAMLASMPELLQSLGPPVEGVELDSSKLGQVAYSGGRRTFRVVATAKIGKVEKQITAVWDSETQNQNARDPAYGRGAWVYWREE
ncbi:MAG: hypothetical protein V2A73_18535 [Pseudomonadota bacterium]